jgi:hypothetical protein
MPSEQEEISLNFNADSTIGGGHGLVPRHKSPRNAGDLAPRFKAAMA